MGRPLKKTMSDGKREIISRLISEYDIHSVGDIEEALKDLLGGTIMQHKELQKNVGKIPEIPMKSKSLASIRM